MQPEPDERPDPRDYETFQDYEQAMEDYLHALQTETGETSPMDAIRRWRESPPKDGWE